MRDTYVYVITAKDQPYAKIGVAGNPEKRLKQLQTASPFSLSLFWVSDAMTRNDALRCEAGAHFIMGSARMAGEWFYANPSAAKAIAMSVEDLINHGKASDLQPFADGFNVHQRTMDEGGDTFATFMAIHALFERRLQ